MKTGRSDTKLTRRDFLRLLVTAGSAITLSPLLKACSPADSTQVVTATGTATRGTAATGFATRVPAAAAASATAVATELQPAAGQPPPLSNQPAPAPASASEEAQYNIEQAISDNAQMTTIAFDAFAFLTGSLGADSFFPPGKVADFWGFQYLRDNDPSQMGHNTDFLTRASLNMLQVLTTSQKAALLTLARNQVESINSYGYQRFVLMDAFRRLLGGTLPTGATALDPEAVAAFSAEIYRLDGQISYERAQVMGAILYALTTDQRTYLDAMVGQGMTSWPNVDEPAELRGLSRDEKVAVMTYAGDLFSWYAGSLEADVYFCPERHGTYFGSFYLKDAPAVGNPGYTIPTNLTGDMGRTFLAALNAAQAGLVTSLVDIQRPSLYQIVDTRRAVATQLRLFMSGGYAERGTVLDLMGTYGELDGRMVYNYATSFALVGQSLLPGQETQLQAYREQLLGALSLPNGAYLYSQAIPLPTIPNTDFLFEIRTC